MPTNAQVITLSSEILSNSAEVFVKKVEDNI